MYIYIHYNTSTSPTEASPFVSFFRAFSVAAQRDPMELSGYKKIYVIRFSVTETPCTNLVPKVFESIDLRNGGVISHCCCSKQALLYRELFCQPEIHVSVETK